MCPTPDGEGGEGAGRLNKLSQALFVGRAFCGRGIGVCLSCALALLMVSEAVIATVGSTDLFRITERPKLRTSETGEPGIGILPTSPTGVWPGPAF